MAASAVCFCCVVFVWRRRRARAATRLPRGRFVACSMAVRPFACGRAAREGRTVDRGEVCVHMRRRPKNVGARVRGAARQERFYERWLPLLSAAAAVRALAAAGPAAGRFEDSLWSAPQRTVKSMGGSTRLKSAQDGWELGVNIGLVRVFGGPRCVSPAPLRAPGRDNASGLASGWLPRRQKSSSTASYLRGQKLCIRANACSLLEFERLRIAVHSCDPPC